MKINQNRIGGLVVSNVAGQVASDAEYARRSSALARSDFARS